MTALHARGSGGRTLFSGGSDGAVRRWDLDKLPVDGPRRRMRDLGLHACACAGGGGFVVQHDDSVTHLAHHDDQAASASRDGARLAVAAPVPAARRSSRPVRSCRAIRQEVAERSGQALPLRCVCVCMWKKAVRGVVAR